MSFTEEKPLDKVYYTIGEVSGMLGESQSLIRFWSGRFPSFIKPVRNKKGNRLFTAKDVENFRLLHHYIKDLGMTLEGAEKRMRNNSSTEERRLAVIEKLKSIRGKLSSIAEELNSEELSEAGFSDEDKEEKVNRILGLE
ncbi:MAG: MerR family transcriptional regulator [Candidatus Egerieousia sp.]